MCFLLDYCWLQNDMSHIGAKVRSADMIADPAYLARRVILMPTNPAFEAHAHSANEGCRYRELSPRDLKRPPRRHDMPADRGRPTHGTRSEKSGLDIRARPSAGRLGQPVRFQPAQPFCRARIWSNPNVQHRL